MSATAGPRSLQSQASPPLLPCAPARAAFLIDFDGTLAEIAAAPLLARPHPDAASVLSRLLATTEGAVALVTGRPIATIDALLDVPGLSIAGIHGLERRDASGRTWRNASSAPEVAMARRSLQRFVEACPRLLLEDKGLSLALHYRAAPALAQVADDVTARIVAHAGGELLRIKGSMVFEIAPPTASKSAAVRAVLTDPQFHGRAPVYLGDDEVDEDAFRLVNELGGLSVQVGRPRPSSSAQARLESVDAAVGWLARLAGGSGDR